MTTPERLADFLVAARREVEGEVRDDSYSRILYSTDASLYQFMPHAVVIPRTADDVAATVALAAGHGVPVLARAAGTSLAGQAVNEAVVIDFTRHLDAIAEINAEERWARVQPGVVLDDLNAALRRHRLQFGPDPASSNRSTIGGAVANNATGSHSIRYGMSADHVQGMKVVLSDGTRVKLAAGASPDSAFIRITNGIDRLLADPANRRTIREGTPRHWRRCGGYNLDRMLAEQGPNPARLVAGSEGTLAVMTEITVGLVPLPARTGLVLLHFEDLYRALSAVPSILETDPSAVELLDTLSLRLCRQVPEYDRLLASVVTGQPHSLLIVEYEGENEAAVRAGVDRLLALRGLGAKEATPALTADSQAAIWAVRKVGLGLLMSLKGDMKPVPFIEDAAVPVAHLPEYVRRIEAYCGDLGMPITYYAHASAGCLHIRPLLNRRSAAEVARMPDIAAFAAELVKGYRGALSSEHGDGRSRSWLNEAFFGPELYGLYRQVKQLFDPHNLFNPGIIVDGRPMTEGLRALRADGGQARLDFSDYEGRDEALRIASSNEGTAAPTSGFIRAVEMCNGAGVCRQRIAGTMCPSFMVTREEEHSTRGRANALRAALSGVLPVEELTSPRMYAVMDLCIGCKACKAECPSAVDMARLKTEFLARYYEVHGVPLRARFFGHVAMLNRLGSGWRAAPAGGLLRLAAVRRWMGLAPERTLPPLARRTFMHWWRARARKTTGETRARRMLLLIDPFTDYNYPEVGIAAAEFLERAGWAVEAKAVDEGRGFLSKGLLAEARRTAERTVADLARAAERDWPIVGLEPSSLLTLRDEYRYLLPGDSRARAVEERALTFEEFVDNLAAADELELRFREEPRRVLLHGHCHQKALVGTGPARRVLALPPGYTVEEVDSGCCGMAGSFGYEAEHYDISMRMAERRLLPAVRAAAPLTIIAAAGVSCRQQIAHGSGRKALHPAEVLRAALADS